MSDTTTYSIELKGSRVCTRGTLPEAARDAADFLLDGQAVKVVRLEGQARRLLTDAEDAILDRVLAERVESEAIAS